MIAVPALKSSWKKREVERAERRAVKEYERELRDAAQKEKQVGYKPTRDTCSAGMPATIVEFYPALSTSAGNTHNHIILS